MVVLIILIVALDYAFKEDELYFQLFTLADKLNLRLVLKFKEEAGQFVVAGYMPNHPAAFYKIVLNANESIKLERTLEMATLIGDYLEDFFKLVKD